MLIHPDLKSRLQLVVLRQRRLHFWCRLAACWAVCGLAFFAIAAVFGHNLAAGSIWPILALAGIGAAVITLRRHGSGDTDWRQLAAVIEQRHPELEGRLLTAVQQPIDKDAEFGYLQQRLVQETVNHAQANDWAANLIPLSRIRAAQALQWAAVAILVIACFDWRVSNKKNSPASSAERGVTVSPGDTTLERGSTLVVLAKFGGGLLPASVDLVVGEGTANKRIPLVKSLADPMFGASVAEVSSNLVYHVEFAGQRTRDFKVSVFEYPRLERADADLVFPEYTGQAPKHVANTKRVSAVQGSQLDLQLRLNKSVITAELIPKKEGTVVPLVIEKDHPTAALKGFTLESSETYELRLVDGEGRTNKVPAQFVLVALTNRPPEIHLASPRGDQRPSPLEEVSFEGTVWDDFGVKAYGLGYTVAGQEPKWIELGKSVPAAEKRPFKYLLRLEDLGVQPDELISWFVWADDFGPDGQLRRTTGDLFFGEVRPFEEVFREGQGMEGQGQGSQSGQQEGGATGRLTELQKQIISATWKLQQQPAPLRSKRGATSADPQSRYEKLWHNYSHFMGQVDPSVNAGNSSSATRLSQVGGTSTKARDEHSYAEDAGVVRDAQAQALEQAQTALENQRDQRASALWRSAEKEMEKALARLQVATNSPTELKEALAAEQAAYQALLRLQEHEYQVSRSRNRSQQGGGRSQQMQRQLEEMDLTQSENRYETQSEAQKPQPSQRREQLQVMNRLQELARRQQDLNDRLKELQTALQEARTEEERAEIQRRLKRLQEEEQQMLSDIDEVRQRMDRPENQSNMANERQQLDQTRNEVQRAAEAAGQGAASQALAAGTRAQQQLQQAREQMRKENSSQFADDLRQMRSEARELARQQEQIQQQMEPGAASDHKSLSDAPGQQQLSDQFAQQKQRMTNLVERATDISQQAEQAEPLLSQQLYDTVRKFSQDSAKDLKDLQDDLINRGMMTRSLYDQLKESSDPDGVKLLDLTSDLLNRHLLPQASQSGQRARAGIDNLKQGVERAANSVLGDDTEALRLAQQQLDQLSEELKREMAQAQTGAQTNGVDGVNAGRQARPGDSTARGSGNGTNEVSSETTLAQAGERADRTPGADQNGDQTEPGSAQGQRHGAQPGQQGQAQGGQRTSDSATQAGEGRSEQLAQNDQGGRAGQATSRGGADAGGDWRNGGYAGGNGGDYLNRFLNDGHWRPYGPLTGEDFVPWADRLRDVEEMIDDPALRNEIATARERARLLRQDFKRDRKKPDWAVVQLQVLKPLVSVRDQIADELARRDSREALVPVDRDPVPDRYSDLVRRYYEGLSKQK